MRQTRDIGLTPSFGQNSWQKKTAVICSIQFMQQRSLLSARARTQEVPKTCCLYKLASESKQACADTYLRLLCCHLYWHKCAVYIPDPNQQALAVPCFLPSSLTQAQIADYASSFLAEQRLPHFIKSKALVFRLDNVTCKGVVSQFAIQDWGMLKCTIMYSYAYSNS